MYDLRNSFDNFYKYFLVNFVLNLAVIFKISVTLFTHKINESFLFAVITSIFNL